MLVILLLFGRYVMNLQETICTLTHKMNEVIVDVNKLEGTTWSRNIRAGQKGA